MCVLMALACVIAMIVIWIINNFSLQCNWPLKECESRKAMSEYITTSSYCMNKRLNVQMSVIKCYIPCVYFLSLFLYRSIKSLKCFIQGK